MRFVTFESEREMRDGAPEMTTVLAPPFELTNDLLKEARSVGRIAKGKGRERTASTPR
jgi:hypothetical protein